MFGILKEVKQVLESVPSPSASPAVHLEYTRKYIYPLTIRIDEYIKKDLTTEDHFDFMKMISEMIDFYGHAHETCQVIGQIKGVMPCILDKEFKRYAGCTKCQRKLRIIEKLCKLIQAVSTTSEIDELTYAKTL